MHSKRITQLAATALAGILLSGLAWAADDADNTIEPQPLTKALTEFAEQTGMQLVYPSELTAGVESKGASTDGTPDETLDQLLASTGLDYEYINDRTISIAAQSVSDESSEDDQESGKSQPASSQVLMAQNQTSAQQTRTSRNNETTTEQDNGVTALEEIVVVGTHIRGTAPVGSQLITLSRDDIERSGFATVQDLVQSLPQTFGGGPNEIISDQESFSNFTSGSSFNLRGLGAAATLTLVNGRRIPVAGRNSDFFDVSTIPISIVERVEVLPDGASAIYGSDAVGGVINIVLRDDYDGAETQLRYGTVTEGDSEEFRIAQTFGKNWGTGNGVITLEYYERTHLQSADRKFVASDLTPFGGDDFRAFHNSPGNILDVFTGFTTVAFAIPPGQDGTSLTVADLLPGSAAILDDGQIGRQILPDQERISVFAAGSQQVTDRLELFAEGRFSKREFQQETGSSVELMAVFPGNPFFLDAQGIGFDGVAYSFINDFGPIMNDGEQESISAVLGATLDFSDDWELNVFGSYSEENAVKDQQNLFDRAALNLALADTDPATAFNPYGDGSGNNPATLDSIRRSERVDSKSDVWAIDFVVDGSLFRAPGGEAKLAAGVNYREESFNILITPAFFADPPILEREVSAVFGELFVPLVAEGNARPGLQKLSFSAAVRYEKYRGISTASTTNPKIGLVWSPAKDFDIRGSWGTSFKAPKLAELDTTSNSSGIAFLADPTEPTIGFTNTLFQFGNSPDLQNEEADTWSVGMDFISSAVPGLQLSLTYFDIEFTDRIAAFDDPFNILVNESLFPGRVNRMPTQADLDAICLAPSFFGDVASCTLGLVGAIVDFRRLNEAITEVSGLDLTAAFGFDTNSQGRFDFRIDGSHLIDFKRASTSSAPLVDRLNTVTNPVDLVLRNSVTWSKSGLSVTAFVNYKRDYTDESVTTRKVDSWTTVDLTAIYDFGARSDNAVLSGTTLSVSALNLFDEDPPFVNRDRLGHDPANASLMGRFVSLNLTKKW